MHEPDPPTEDLPTTGRHRATPPTLRQIALRTSLGAGALGVVGTLAVLTATAAGLTGTPPPAAQVQAAPSADLPPGGSLVMDATRGGRGSPSTEALSTEALSTEVPQPLTDSPAPAPARAPASPPTSAPAPDPVTQPPSAVPDVRSGAPCPAAGARGTTGAGRPAVCTVRGDGTPRWRHA